MDTMTTSQGFMNPSPSENIQNALPLFIISIVGPILATLLVANRLVFRFRITGGLGLDDWCIVLATVRVVTPADHHAKDSRSFCMFKTSPLSSQYPTVMVSVPNTSMPSMRMRRCL
jgi:hypothetical protein